MFYHKVVEIRLGPACICVGSDENVIRVVHIKAASRCDGELCATRGQHGNPAIGNVKIDVVETLLRADARSADRRQRVSKFNLVAIQHDMDGSRNTCVRELEHCRVTQGDELVGTVGAERYRIFLEAVGNLDGSLDGKFAAHDRCLSISREPQPRCVVPALVTAQARGHVPLIRVLRLANVQLCVMVGVIHAYLDAPIATFAAVSAIRHSEPHLVH
jgi:hypothetical protein